MTKGIVYDGNKNRFVPLKKATVPITDLAVLRGVGLIEVMRTYNRVPFKLAEHLKRLRASEKIVGLKRGTSDAFIKGKIFKGIKRFGRECVVKILVTGGPSTHLRIEFPPGFYILFMPLVTYPEKQYRQGTKLLTARYERTFPEAKSTEYLFAVRAHDVALESGYDEVLYIDRNKNISEGTSFNFAIIRGKKLVTSDKQVLRGVTMEAAARLARKLGLKVERRAIRYRELSEANEAFTASTLREVVPVVKVDKIKIGNGRPGKYSKMLLKDFRFYATKQKKNNKPLSYPLPSKGEREDS